MTNEKLNLVFVFQQNFQPYRPSKVKVNKTLKKILFSISPKKQGQSGRIKKKISIFFWRNWRQESDVLRFPDHYLSCWRQENIRGRYARVIEIYSLAVAGLLPSPKLRPPLHIEKTLLKMFCMFCNHKSNTFHESAKHLLRFSCNYSAYIAIEKESSICYKNCAICHNGG